MGDAFTQYKMGLNHAPAYTVSGIPFVTGSLTVPNSSGTPISVSFPYVTRKIMVHLLTDKAQVRVGFSENGVKDAKHFVLDTNGNGRTGYFEMEVKSTKIFLLSNGASTTSVSVGAEMTGIPSHEYDLASAYSGSAGVG